MKLVEFRFLLRESALSKQQPTHKSFDKVLQVRYWATSKDGYILRLEDQFWGDWEDVPTVEESNNG